MNLATATLLASWVILAFSTSLEAGGFVKWVDENGVTHYGTSIPPQYKDQPHTELDQRGIRRNQVDRAKTPEEIERDKAIAALRAEQQRLLEEQQARDRILLNLYRNEDDLLMARDGKIAQINSQIALKRKDIVRLKDRLSKYQAQAAAAERSGRKVSDQQQANLDSTQRSIQQAYALILTREDEKKVTIEKYNYDLQRFRKLRTGSARAQNTDVAKPDIPDLVDTAVRCGSVSECDRLWAQALAYARGHATTPIDLAADRILVTAPPRQLRDISITVSRLRDRDGDGERIFMDIQCANFTEGREYCRGESVTAIREQFRPALSSAQSAGN